MQPTIAKQPETPPPVLTSFQREFLQRINEIRSKGCHCGNTYMPPVPPVTWNVQLQMAAMAHAKDMNKNKYVSHINRSGKSSKDRIAAAGYTINGYRSYYVGENIAWGQRTIKEVMTGWINSEGHCLNIMNKSYKEVGAYMENYYLAQEFGGRK
ncbi:MAG TPA: CAP domain-containing protein [Pedobacter sp.]